MSEQLSPYLTPPEMSYLPGTVLVDPEGRYWMVRDGGKVADGTGGGAMVDLRRGEVVFSPATTPTRPEEGEK